MKYCRICQGSKYVRLPLYGRASASYEANDLCLCGVEESYREYPCPECNSGAISDQKVEILHASNSVRTCGKIEDGMVDAVKNNIARILASGFLQRGMIDFEQEQRGDDTVFFGTLGVVSPKAVNTIERRALEKMTGFLGCVLSDAARHIQMWGSHYTGDEGGIRKGQAVSYVREAFDRHLQTIRDEIEARKR